MPEIETLRLRLRMPSPQDVEDVALLFADPEVMTFIGIEAGTTLSREETENALAKMNEFWARNGFGRWTVIEKESGKLIGLCGLRLYEGTPELFYLFEKPSWGKGYATEAASAVLRYGFEEKEFERIIAGIRAGNANSLKVANKIGMIYEKELNLYGVHCQCYVVTRSEFEPLGGAYVFHANDRHVDD